ncbi:MAG: hypothetical protein ABR586_03805 [Thermoplasmatota archaeon]
MAVVDGPDLEVGGEGIVLLAGDYAVYVTFEGPVGVMPDQAVVWEAAGEA